MELSDGGQLLSRGFLRGVCVLRERDVVSLGLRLLGNAANFMAGWGATSLVPMAGVSRRSGEKPQGRNEKLACGSAGPRRVTLWS